MSGQTPAESAGCGLGCVLLLIGGGALAAMSIWLIQATDASVGMPSKLSGIYESCALATLALLGLLLLGWAVWATAMKLKDAVPREFTMTCKRCGLQERLHVSRHYDDGGKNDLTANKGVTPEGASFRGVATLPASCPECAGELGFEELNRSQNRSMRGCMFVAGLAIWALVIGVLSAIAVYDPKGFGELIEEIFKTVLSRGSS